MNKRNIQNNDKHGDKKKYLTIISLLISIISVLISVYNFYNLQKENQPNIKLVQNLWSNSPSFSLLNEGSAKLDQVPYPTYFMYIPTKVHWISRNSDQSNLVLTPISYTAIKEQINGSHGTKSEISKSLLPKEFKSKFGERDKIISDEIKLEKNLKIKVETLPFLLIISPVEYSYRGKVNKIILLNTPNMSKNINESEYKSILKYTRDNSDLELDVKKAEKDNKSIYELANKQIQIRMQKFKEKKLKDIKFLGGRKDGYNQVLKKLNEDISPIDPLN